MTKKTIPLSDGTDEQPAVVDDVQDLIDQITGDVVVRIYRRTVTDTGRVKLFFCGKHECIVDEQDVGELYGPGNYMVHFRWRNKEGEREQTTRNWNIGEEFAKGDTVEGAAGALEGTQNAPAACPAPASVPAQAATLGGILGNITIDKIMAGVALLEKVKQFLAPPPPPDNTKLIELLLANQRGQSVGDAVVIEALKQANKPAQPAPTVMEQINNLKAVRDAFAGDFAGGEQSTRGSDKMDSLIEMGLKYLPDLLAKHNNNFSAAGAEAAQHNFVKNLIANDPDLTQKFFDVATNKYGKAAAQQLAAGFGIELNFADEAGAAEPPQIAQQPAQAIAQAQQGSVNNG